MSTRCFVFIVRHLIERILLRRFPLDHHLLRTDVFQCLRSFFSRVPRPSVQREMVSLNIFERLTPIFVEHTAIQRSNCALDEITRPTVSFDRSAVSIQIIELLKSHDAIRAVRLDAPGPVVPTFLGVTQAGKGI